MKQIIIAILLLVAFAGSIDAGQTRSYTRKDGTHVSGYTTGGVRGIDTTVGVVATGILLVVGCIWWIVSSALSGNTNRQDARHAALRERAGILRQQVRRAQMKKEDPIAKGLSLGQEAQRASGTQSIRKAHPFNLLPLTPANWLFRMLGRLPTQNAFTELNNALAASDTVRQVSLDDISKLNTKYKTDLHRTSPKQMEILYKEFMAFCLADRKFVQEEVDDLWHLKDLFCFSDKLHNAIYDEVGQEVYRRSISQVLADSQIAEEEKKWLEKIASDLELPEDVKQRIYKTETQPFLQRKVDEAIADRQLSPDEDREIQELTKRLGGKIITDGATSSVLEKYRLMWRIAHGDPPSINVSLTLQRGEVCYFATPVTWHEMRRVTERIQWGGLKFRAKIYKGLSFNMGDYAVNPITQDILAPIDSGTVYVTSKRLLFTGKMKNVSIKLEKILDIKPYKNGVTVEKDSGKSPFLAFNSNVDIFTACLARAIQDVG
jgi:hypothetical protein